MSHLRCASALSTCGIDRNHDNISCLRFGKPSFVPLSALYSASRVGRRHRSAEDFPPQNAYEKFQICFLTSFILSHPLPSLVGAITSTEVNPVCRTGAVKRALFAAAVAGQIRRESPESNTFTPDSNEPISDVMIMAAGNNLNYGGTTTDARGNFVLRAAHP